MKYLFPVLLAVIALTGAALTFQHVAPRLAFLLQPAVATAATPAGVWEAHLPVEGTPMRVAAPRGFRPHPTHPGFRDEQHDASLLVFVLDEPFAQVSRRLTRSDMAERGLTLEHRDTLRIDEVPGVMVTAAQEIEGGPRYTKLIAAAGDHEHSVMIVATYRHDAPQELAKSLEQAVRTARFETGRRPDVLGDLPFRVEPVPGFVVARRSDAAVLYTRDPGLAEADGIALAENRADADAAIGPGHTTFLAGTEETGAEVIDRRTFAEQRLALIPGVRDVLIHASNYASVGGLPAYEIVATGMLNDRDEPCVIHQTLAFDGTTVYVLQGTGLYRNRQTCLDQFRAMTGTLRVRPTPPMIALAGSRE